MILLVADPELVQQTAVMRQQAWILVVQAGLMFFQLVAIAWGLWYTARQIRMGREQVKTDSTYECDRLYLEVMKSVLADDELQRFFAYGTPQEVAEFEAMPKVDRRVWLLGELHLFQFSFVYREWQLGRVPQSYWNVWDRFLRDLVAGSPTFRDVCRYDLTYFGGSVAEDGRVPFNVYMVDVFRTAGQSFERQSTGRDTPG
jgi:hypothetical protein